MPNRRFELENNVWNLDRCAGCGMCVAACSRGQLCFESSTSHPTFNPKVKNVGLSAIEVDTCSFCEGMCAESCPRLKEWEKEEYHRIFSAKTTRNTHANPVNEIIVDLLSAGLANEFIDAILIMDVNKWHGKPYSRVIRSIDELYRVSGTQNIWIPILPPLYQRTLTKEFRKIAIVGPPCVAQAVKCVSNSSIEGLSILRNVVGLSLSTFCSGFYEPALLDDLTSRLKVSPSEILSIGRSSENANLEIKLTNGKIELIPLEEVQKYMREGCARCTDYLGESADISVGQTGSKNGFSTLIVWNSKGRGFLNNCVNFNLIELSDNLDQEALVAARENKERRLRVQAFDSLLIYSLESLTDKDRLEDMKKRFLDLFSRTRNIKSSKTGDGCSECINC
ncbi:MAG: Coenzyme F420 hydrogenase/dehydrogenase, beta subunit C-terminal domain [Candidatus Hermodarchaeota archaeon]